MTPGRTIITDIASAQSAASNESAFQTINKCPHALALRQAQDDTHLRHDFGILGIDKMPA